jgi:hypothetical protein
MLKNFIKKIWVNKFGILAFVFTWLLPLAYVGTKVKYVEINIAWKITVYGVLALLVLYVALRKELHKLLLKKTGFKSLKDYLITRPYGFWRGFLLRLLTHFKQGIILLVMYFIEKLTHSLTDDWLLIISITAIGSMFYIIHNIVKKEKAVIVNEEAIS